MTTLDELLNSGGAGFFNKGSKVGDTVTGTLLGATVVQRRDFVTKQPLTWDDGRPQMQVVLSLQTDLRDPNVTGDNGVRSVYVKTWGDNWRAFRAALAGVNLDTQLGGQMTVTFESTKPSKQGDPEKLFSFKYNAPEPQAAAPQAPEAAGEPIIAGFAPSPEALAAFEAYRASQGQH